MIASSAGFHALFGTAGLTLPAHLRAAPGPSASGWFALHAIRAADVLAAAAVLYPEQLLPQDQQGQVTWSVRVSQPESLHGLLRAEDTLVEGMELRLEPRG